MKISIIVAKGANNAIGNKGGLPWNCPEDWAYFLNTTEGFPVIMGQNVYQELPKGDFNGWTKLVLSHKPDYQIEDGVVFNSLPDAVTHARGQEYAEVFIIGGTSPYREGLEIADQLYLTYMHSVFEADTFFPCIDYRKWKLKEQSAMKSDPEVPFTYQFTVWERAE